jgi:hypothetical protein
MSMTTFDGVKKDPLNVAAPERLKVHRETPPGAKVLPTNCSPHGLKSTPAGPLSAASVV